MEELEATAKDSEVAGEGPGAARAATGSDGMDRAEDDCGMLAEDGCCDGVGSCEGRGLGPGSPVALETEPPGDSEGGRRSLEVGHSPASEDETLAGSCLAAVPLKIGRAHV